MKEVIKIAKCGKKCEVFSRVVGYYRPVQGWNEGKAEEFKERKPYCEKKSMESAENKKFGLENVKEEVKQAELVA